MSDHTPENKDTPPVATQNGEINPSRRKLTGAALGVSAIFTLASRPVLAGTCNSPSAAASGNLSHHGAPPNCMGQTPAVLALMDDSDSRNVEFHKVFSSGTHANWGNNKLKQVMLAADNNNGFSPTDSNPANNPNPISKEFAATLLNIRAGSVLVPASVLTEMQLIGMWNEWMDTGGFTPTAGATPWNATQIVTYLRTLQGS